MGDRPPRTRRPRATAALMVLSVVAVVLAVVVTGWFLVAVPFALIGAYGTWLGLSDEELLDALDEAGGDDPGRGPSGVHL